ncbi:putative leucine-rich repeat domain superfamily [Helianthus annuus]|uniref:Leucine-rich repeat domain superfamily n=1 Tax=Helianthus annuus TaxID=4232 RepID=A0A9K3JGN5_HELAN|nr:putative leucine-rich repeat domain superfamily [Helianthus annuus]KAJ0593335.1 putative leucine-rich repeat domain superfamily [Helianthus annuus]KAJ0608345.1 putative leucine-rich repeat domain superfamily [Helianthus annuus]KAJ0768410.1 putative leucine-rich repeat domain superfamily [Helianthus annuus]KAJ0936079.1 putative leucine-rich repeat domain superfamily [Helianthus annuus]
MEHQDYWTARYIIAPGLNSLAGEVPDELTNLKSLSELYLSNNNLIQSVPDLLGMKIEYNVLNSEDQIQRIKF